MREEVGFWVTVMIAAVVGVALFKIVGTRLGDRVPALGQLAAFV